VWSGRGSRAARIAITRRLCSGVPSENDSSVFPAHFRQAAHTCTRRLVAVSLPTSTSLLLCLSRGLTMASALTPREREVVRLASLGCTCEEIGKILKLAKSTADCHKACAMAKLGVDKAPLLARLALKLKVTSMNDKLTPAEKQKSGRKNDGWN